MSNFKMTGHDLYDSRGHKVAKVVGDKIYNDRNHQVGKVVGDKVYDERNHQVLQVDGGKILDDKRHNIGSMKDVAKAIDHATEGATAAALWHFFVR